MVLAPNLNRDTFIEKMHLDVSYDCFSLTKLYLERQ